MAGLLGMGGLGGAFGGPNTGMLSGPLAQLFNPANMRNAQIKKGLLSAGIAMMNPDPRAPPAGIGGILGRAAAGGFQGAQAAKDEYMQDGMMGLQLQQMQKEQDTTDAEKAEMEKLLPSLPPDVQGFARTHPGAFMQAYTDAKIKAQFSGETPKPPGVETFYDDKTGQPYKGQWNPTTQKWDRVGGNKADENGITITNPDGTTTQIGGSGSKTTEADRRAQLLFGQVASQEPQLMADFDTLATVQNSVGGATGIAGRGLMTAEGQMAKDSLTNVLANWLYLTSGATMNQGEIDRQVGLMLPGPLDKPETIAAKKARVQSIFATMKARVGGQTGAPASGGGGVTFTYNPKTGKLE